MLNKTHCIIFIPGFKGSILHNENDDFIWPNVFRAQFSRASLHYDLPELGLANAHQYHATNIVKSISLIPYLLYIDYYSHFLNQLHNKFSNQATILTFSYDWRDHLTIAIANLTKLLLKLHSEGVTKVDLICHSMGGLIASYLLRYGNAHANTVQNETTLFTLINKVYLIGTPFQGAIKFLKKLIDGDCIGLNRTLLSQAALYSFPSTYYLLPFDTNSLRVINDKEDQNQSLSDITIWKKFKFGILNHESSNVVINENRLHYLNNCLSAAYKFHSLLHAVNNETIVPAAKLIHITSKDRETFSTLEIDSKLNQLNWQYDIGDGSVPFSSTSMPDFFKRCESKNYLVNAEHAKMLVSNEVQDIIWQELAGI